MHQDLPVHSDGFDQHPDEAPHTSVEHTIRAIHGGEGIDHTGRAEVSVQLEQDRHLTSGPTATLSVTVQGIEQYAWLTLPEARAVHQALAQLLTETENGSR